MYEYGAGLSEAWRALTKFAADAKEAVYDGVKRKFESLEIRISEPVAEYFARVHVILKEVEDLRAVVMKEKVMWSWRKR